MIYGDFSILSYTSLRYCQCTRNTRGSQLWDAPQTVGEKYIQSPIGAGLDRLVLLTRGILADGAQRNRRPLSPSTPGVSLRIHTFIIQKPLPKSTVPIFTNPVILRVYRCFYPGGEAVLHALRNSEALSPSTHLTPVRPCVHYTLSTSKVNC